MIGNPGDTLETVKESLEFARSQRFASAAFYLALPYPKTELWDYVKEHGRFLKEDYMQFHHFSEEPVFDTPEFRASDRSKAYELGRELSIKTSLREEMRTKLTRIRRLDFEGLSIKRMGKAAVRLAKHFLDLSFKRREKV
jgi:anaerobic magnesium-protoporphyrin IX monomethyl ester cyclase